MIRIHASGLITSIEQRLVRFPLNVYTRRALSDAPSPAAHQNRKPQQTYLSTNDVRGVAVQKSIAIGCFVNCICTSYQ